MVAQVETSYCKDDWLKGYFRYQHETSSSLHIQRYDGRHNYEYTVDLALLSPDYEEKRRIAWHWLMAAALLSAAALFLVYQLFTNLSAETIANTAPGILFFLALAGGCILFFFSGSCRQVVFYSRHFHYPLVKIDCLGNRCDQFARFVGQLAQRIEQEADSAGAQRRNLDDEEREMLRRLESRGVISDEAVPSAAPSVLGHSH